MNKNKKTEFCFLITVFCILVFLCWSVGHSFSASPAPSENSLKPVLSRVEGAGYQNSVANISDDLSELLRKRLMPAEVIQAEPIEPNVAEVTEPPSSTFTGS